MSISEAFRADINAASDDDAAIIRAEIARYSGETIDTEADAIRFYIIGG